MNSLIGELSISSFIYEPCSHISDPPSRCTVSFNCSNRSRMRCGVCSPCFATLCHRLNASAASFGIQFVTSIPIALPHRKSGLSAICKSVKRFGKQYSKTTFAKYSSNRFFAIIISFFNFNFTGFSINFDCNMGLFFNLLIILVTPKLVDFFSM